uniref:Uncharacterized protein n=1 Tax=Rhizophora mucronata TaxID=61149 RepID=A0A2P2QBG9_RHIMU
MCITVWLITCFICWDFNLCIEPASGLLLLLLALIII